MNTDLLCKTHYLRKFASSGGVLEMYQPTPAFIRLLEQKHATQKEIAAAHKALLERQQREQQELRKRDVDQTSVVYAVDGAEFDINEILKSIPLAPSSSGEVSAKAAFVQSMDSIYGVPAPPSSLDLDDPRMYRTLSQVKEYDM